MKNNSNPLITLGIETSCDDTSICILKSPKSEDEFPEILAHQSFSQELLLSRWGGVVPEIAARHHVAKITPLLEACFEKANIAVSDVNLIGVTTHPGLLGPLLTGLNAAKTLSLFHQIPILPVNHLFAHLEAIHLTEKVHYPYIGLLASGGHSAFFLVKSGTDFEILGNTIDDAAGEAFDKGGKLMRLGYPAGRIIDILAKHGNPKRFDFPIGLEHSGDANMSFSGVKTSMRVFLDKHPDILPEETAKGEKVSEDPSLYSQDFLDLCASYQEAIIQAMCKKIKKVAGRLPIVVGGGVACNSRLRSALSEEFSKTQSVHFVRPSFCTDNGAMIANYASRNVHLAVNFPECLELDARSRYIEKAGTLSKTDKA